MMFLTLSIFTGFLKDLEYGSLNLHEYSIAGFLKSFGIKFFKSSGIGYLRFLEFME